MYKRTIHQCSQTKLLHVLPTLGHTIRKNIHDLRDILTRSSFFLYKNKEDTKTLFKYTIKHGGV